MKFLHRITTSKTSLLTGTLWDNLATFIDGFIIMSTPLLQQVLNVIKDNTHSGQALLLFALCKTLDIEKGGHMYLLAKLKDIDADNRQLAYQLMEYMADGHTGSEEWNRLIIELENIIRG